MQFCVQFLFSVSGRGREIRRFLYKRVVFLCVSSYNKASTNKGQNLEHPNHLFLFVSLKNGLQILEFVINTSSRDIIIIVRKGKGTDIGEMWDKEYLNRMRQTKDDGKLAVEQDLNNDALLSFPSLDLESSSSGGLENFSHTFFRLCRTF